MICCCKKISHHSLALIGSVLLVGGCVTPPPPEPEKQPSPVAPPSVERKEEITLLSPATINVLMAKNAELRGGLCQFPGWPEVGPNQKGAVPKLERDRKKWKTYAERGHWWVEVWESPDDAFVWTVVAPEAGYYNVRMLGTGRDSLVEVAAGDSKATGWINNGYDTMWDVGHFPPTEKNAKWRADFKPPDDYFRMVWSGWDKMPLGTIHLAAGTNTITVKATRPGKDLALYSLELVLPETEIALKEKARKMRADTRWLADSKYGLFFHWTSSTNASSMDSKTAWESVWPREGDRKPFPKNVEDFNVPAFVDMVKETGASYIIFSATWAAYCFPAPIKAVDDLMPGRTSKRDLIMELADGLDKHGIRLMLYYNHFSDKEWRKVTDPHLVENWCAVMNEVGLRYGKKLAGYWFDCTPYASNVPFEILSEAAKAGFPDRVIGYTQGNFFPSLTDFQDYSAGEGAQFWVDQALLRHVPKGGSGIFNGGRQEGLQAHQSFAIEKIGWIHNMPNEKLSDPLWTKELLIEQVKNAAERKFAPALAIAVYEDGTASPKTLELLKALRIAIRGE